MGKWAISGPERRGRPQSIPPAAFVAIFQFHSQGFGVRRIVQRLEVLGVYSTKSSVSRLLLGQGVYNKRLTKPHQS